MVFKLTFLLALFFGKIVLFLLQLTGRTGTALPGRIALFFCPTLLEEIGNRCHKKIIITGTNGKTTTNNLVASVLNRPGISLLSNLRGSNMRQGIASAFLSDTRKDYDWGLFESDERAFPGLVRALKPDFVLVTNFFRDQLDRYGEIETTVGFIKTALDKHECVVVLNADDPFTAGLGWEKSGCVYYGVRSDRVRSSMGHIAETLFCPVCGNRLSYEAVNYGQLGIYSCPSCGNRNPGLNFELTHIREEKNGFVFDILASDNRLLDVAFHYPGFYNLYNCAAAWALCKTIGIGDAVLRSSLEGFEYKLGRMEDFMVRGKQVRLTLVKNPVGFSEVLKNIAGDSGTKTILFVLNDNANDGRDVSWIWDADMEQLGNVRALKSVFCSGQRCRDMAVRVKYAGVSGDLLKAADENIPKMMDRVMNENTDRIYVLPTYSALYRIRNWLDGV